MAVMFAMVPEDIVLRVIVLLVTGQGSVFFYLHVRFESDPGCFCCSLHTPHVSPSLSCTPFTIADFHCSGCASPGSTRFSQGRGPIIDRWPLQVLYMPSGQVARKLAISPRTLGKITGNLYVQLGDGSKEDIGLFVKHGSKGLCVPDYVQAKPEDKGWAYSQALLQVLEQYKVGSPALLRKVPLLNPECNSDIRLIIKLSNLAECVAHSCLEAVVLE